MCLVKHLGETYTEKGFNKTKQASPNTFHKEPGKYENLSMQTFKLEQVRRKQRVPRFLFF